MDPFKHKSEMLIILGGIILTGIPLLVDRKRSDDGTSNRKPSHPFLLILLFGGITALVFGLALLLFS